MIGEHSVKINAVITKPTIRLDYANNTAILSAAVIAAGILTGSLVYFVTYNEDINSLCEYFLTFITDFSKKNKPEIFSGLILSDLPYLVMMLILGTSVIGTPGILALTYIKSIGIGLLITYIYDSFALKGLEFSLLVLMPGIFVLIFAMILLTQSCFVNSQNINKALNNKENGVLPHQKFFIRSLIIISIFIFSSVLDCVTLTGFSSLFDFS